MTDNSDKQPVFNCQQCGDCCSGLGGIHVKPHEVEAIAALLSMSVEDFSRDYVEASVTGPRLTVADTGFCVFLLEGNLCLVHPVKPFICRQWPFLPALLVNADELAHAKGACPGINPHCTHMEFVAAALSQKEE
ncbi:MAG: YkgJ family cysteine cluster protein [Deltaproteobacteria bacterium]|nr:YkgJ family cysteine cluster protein [Deltaproteobacteria bacterium]